MNNNPSNNKTGNKIIITIICIICVIVAIVLTSAVLLVKKDEPVNNSNVISNEEISNKEESNKEESNEVTSNEEVSNTPSNEVSNSNKPKENIVKTITLSKEKETLKVDEHLVINFTGTKNNEGYYDYATQILLDNKEIKNNAFKNKLFYMDVLVYRIDNIYTIRGYNGSQINGQYAIVINNKGKLLLDVSDVGFNTDPEEKIIFYDKATKIFDENAEVTTYKIENDTLKKG